MARIPHLSRRRRIGVLLICSTSLFMVGLDVILDRLEQLLDQR